MRVALVLGTLHIGGAERQVCRLAKELRQAGHEVAVFAVYDGGPLADELEAVGVEWQAYRFSSLHVGRSLPRQMARLTRFGRELRRFRPDVCHAFLYWADVLATPIAALCRVPVRISGRRGFPVPSELTPYTSSLRRWANRFPTAVVANSRALAAHVIAQESVSEDAMHVIYNGVDLPPEPATVSRCPPTGIVVGNLIAYKGHEVLIDALATLTGPPFVRLFGEGPERVRLEERTRRAGLANVLRFEGQLLGAERSFGDAQFAVHPSHTESFPNAVLEAMAAGLPVVATRVGGVPELVADGETGLLVPPGDVRALADAIARVSADSQLRSRLGTQGRLRAQSFIWKACRDAHVELYEQLLRRRQPRSPLAGRR